jgi:NAD(P)-dependent dehydrogenase (short-subunit alcohol dehydrogenase family)
LPFFREGIMAKTIVVIGFGPGISTAVARKFGSLGFSVALVARNEERLATGVRALKAEKITAAAFPADAGNSATLRAAIGKARAELGPTTVIHWNAFGGAEAGDLLATAPAVVRGVFDIAVVGLLSAVQEALPDLTTTKDGAVLITNGALGELAPQIDEYATRLNAMGVALANGAKYKLVGLLAQRLKTEGVYVGEVMVAGTIKGTPYDHAGNVIEGSAVANKFWDLYQARDEVRVRVS